MDKLKSISNDSDQNKQYVKCFYRVSSKVILTNGVDDAFVVLKNSKGEYELPGGGIEHGESVALSIEREIKEELGISIEVKDSDLRPFFFDVYKSRSHDIWVGFVFYKITSLELDKFEKTTLKEMLVDKEVNYAPYLWSLAKQEFSSWHWQ